MICVAVGLRFGCMIGVRLVLVFGTWCLVLGFRFLVFGTVFCAWYCVRCLVLWYLALEIRARGCVWRVVISAEHLAVSQSMC